MNTQSPKGSDNLTSYLTKGVALVQDYYARFNNDHSVYKSAATYFHDQPVVFTFVAIFTLLSFIPVVFFVCICIVITIALCATSLACALLASVGIILGLSVFLLTALLGILLTSIFLTITSLLFYFFLCLAQRIIRQVPQDISSLSKAAGIGAETTENTIDASGRSENSSDKDSGSDKGEKHGKPNDHRKGKE